MRSRFIYLLCFLSVVMAFASVFAVNSSAADSGNISYDFKKYDFDTSESVITTNFVGTHTYHASVSPISEFFDAKGNYNVVYKGSENIYVAKFNSSMQVTETITLQKQYPVFGGAVCDSSGNYYVVSGQKDTQGSGQIITLCISKYDSNGNLLANVLYKGSDTWDSNWGTKDPFNAGNCSMIIKNNILVCTYAREMYNGYQSNHVIYINCSTMKKLSITAPYCSHSFDQQVIATQSGSFLFVDHGDEFDRGFLISKLSKSSSGKWRVDKFIPFHFREGSNREFGYNETYAQLGGIAEATNGYVIAGTSENTLSYSLAPTTANYCGHNEARNLFIQVFKKDFENYSNSSKIISSAAARNATGTRPSNPGTTLGLTAGTVDYGVKWLTAYSNDYYAANSKIVVTNDDKLVVLWEKMKYGDKIDEYITSYFMVLTNKGNVLLNPVEMPAVRLTSFEVPVYKNGSIYWTTSSGSSNSISVNKLKLTITSQTLVVSKKTSIAQNVVNFNSLGGSSVSKLTIKTGEIIAAPKAPLKSGYIFAGWYKEAACKNAWDFKTNMISNNMTLYAKWKVKSVTSVKAKPISVSNKTPGIPVNFKAVSDLDNSILLNWSSVKGAKGYLIYRYNESTAAYEKIKTTSLNTFKNNALASDTKYYYKVKSYSNVNSVLLYSGYSLTVSCTTDKKISIIPASVSESGSNSKIQKKALVSPAALAIKPWQFSAFIFTQSSGEQLKLLTSVDNSVAAVNGLAFKNISFFSSSYSLFILIFIFFVLMLGLPMISYLRKTNFIFIRLKTE